MNSQPREICLNGRQYEVMSGRRTDAEGGPVRMTKIPLRLYNIKPPVSCILSLFLIHKLVRLCLLPFSLDVARTLLCQTATTAVVCRTRCVLKTAHADKGGSKGEGSMTLPQSVRCTSFIKSPSTPTGHSLAHNL
ncbi:hypothetical protein LIA77_10324 [Sarocladium implicatum]|nr:hypothetical protein LIA77_10324 [Sarocladium implicatum]